MTKWFIAVCSTFFLNTCIAGWDDWSDTDKKLFVASNIAIFADWQTTLDIARNPDKYREVGPIAQRVIGEHPSQSSVNYYFLGRFALNYALADYLESDLKSWYLMITTVGHGDAAIHNYMIGLRIKF